MLPASYRALLRTRSVGSALATSLLARAATPAASLALVLIALQRTGSYAVAGMVSAAWVGGVGVGGLLTSRVVDHGRPRLVLLVSAAVSAAGLVTMAAVRSSSVPLLVGLTAVSALSMPPVGPTARALWPVLLAGSDERAAMYSLEAAAQELIFIVGPSLTALAAAVAAPEAGAVLAAALSLAGTVAFATTASLPRLAPPAERSGGRPSLRLLAVPMLAGGLLVGGLSVTEVAVIARSGQAGAAAAAGVLLAVWSTGSLFGGLIAGAYPPRRGPQRRLVWLLASVALITAVLAAAPGLLLLGVVLVAAGGLVAPALGGLYSQVQQVAPPGAVARTFAMLSTAGMGGAALGAAAAGAVVEAAGAGAAFLLGAALPAAAALMIAGQLRRKVRSARSVVEPSSAAAN
jgi:Major Facilitator Superfamily